MAREDEQRLMDMMKAIEAGETQEDLDQDEMNQESGIRSIKKTPSIKMASETPEEEFDLEIMMMLKEFEDAKRNGYKGTIEDFSNYYFSMMQNKKMQDRKMAMYGGRMQLAEGPKEYGLNEDVIPKRYSDPVTARLETDKEEIAKLREQTAVDDKRKTREPKPSFKKLDVKQIEKMIEDARKKKLKQSKGGIAGVL